jgi:hypothetical protein
VSEADIRGLITRTEKGYETGVERFFRKVFAASASDRLEGADVDGRASTPGRGTAKPLTQEEPENDFPE